MVKMPEFTYDDLRNKILKKAKAIQSLKAEHGYTIECDGELYSFNDNDSGGVDFPLKKIKLAIIALHNHPHAFKEPSSFSGRDVYNLLYYKPHEIMVSSYGVCFSMKNNGCKELPSDVMHTLDNKYDEIDNRLFNKYVQNQTNIPRDMKANYKQYAIEIEREYRDFLLSYAKKINLLYTEEKL